MMTTWKRWHWSGNKKNKLKQQPTVNNQNTKDNLKILLRILSITNISSLLSTPDGATYARRLIDSTRVRTATGCRVFRQSSFRICQEPFNKHLLCGISFWAMVNSDYLVLRYLNTGTLPSEEFSEEWLFSGEVLCSHISETGCGIDSIWNLLQAG
jgi:hypothetical protein